MKTTFHILSHGKLLCYSMAKKKPDEWPKNHRWVAPYETERVTCEECKEEVVIRAKNKHLLLRVLLHQALLALAIYMVAYFFFSYIFSQGIFGSQPLPRPVTLLAVVLAAWFGLRHECRGKDSEFTLQFAWFPRYVGRKKTDGRAHFALFTAYERLVMCYNRKEYRGYHIERQPLGNYRREKQDQMISGIWEKSTIL